MATGQRHETLRLKRPLIGSQGQVSDREEITSATTIISGVGLIKAA
jgi:hypothetical protein